MERVDYEPMLVQDLVSWSKLDELNLSPWYQRRSVWSSPQQAYLINTLFERKPVPTLYFRHNVDLEKDKTVREVVDGQQRIRAVLSYLNNEFSARHPEHVEKVRYEKLTDHQKRRFRETKLSGGWLLGATDADVIEVFGRLNSVAKTLNSQEMRNAKYGGEFKQFCLRQAASRVSMWRTLSIFSANDIARMKEVEFISDLVLNLCNGLSDFTASRLDKIYADNDEEFPKAAMVKKRLDSCFNRIAAITPSAITDTIFCRQPLFFSLLIAIDTAKSAKGKKLEEALLLVDERFNTDKPISDRSQSDAEFYEACRASTQRIASRLIRHKYLMKFLK